MSDILWATLIASVFNTLAGGAIAVVSALVVALINARPEHRRLEQERKDRYQERYYESRKEDIAKVRAYAYEAGHLAKRVEEYLLVLQSGDNESARGIKEAFREQWVHTTDLGAHAAAAAYSFRSSEVERLYRELGDAIWKVWEAIRKDEWPDDRDLKEVATVVGALIAESNDSLMQPTRLHKDKS